MAERIAMNMMISEWNKEENTERDRVAVWGDGPEYPEHIRSIVRDIMAYGYAERGDITYYETEEE